MTRDWKISLTVAILSHVGLLYGFKSVFKHPTRLPEHDTIVEITTIAAPAEPPPAATRPAELAPVVASLPSPPPVTERVKPVAPRIEPPAPSPPPRNQNQPVKPSPPAPTSPTRPTTAPRAQVGLKAPSPPVVVIGDDSSAKPGIDTTTKQAEAGIPAKPNYRKNPEPPYPSAARRRRQEGSVLLAVKVSADGHATRVELKQSSGHAVLDTAAMEAVRAWEFEPARLGARPVASDIEVPVRFQLKP